jgi:hypothetical protein
MFVFIGCFMKVKYFLVFNKTEQLKKQGCFIKSNIFCYLTKQNNFLCVSGFSWIGICTPAWTKCWPDLWWPTKKVIQVILFLFFPFFFLLYIFSLSSSMFLNREGAALGDHFGPEHSWFHQPNDPINRLFSYINVQRIANGTFEIWSQSAAETINCDPIKRRPLLSNPSPFNNLNYLS